MRFAFFLLSSLALAADFTTSLGDQYPYTVSAITTDSAGNTYVVGSRQLGGGTLGAIIGVLSPTPPIVIRSPYFAYFGTDVFVSKLDPNGKLLFTDTFAGKGSDMGTAIALDPSGNIYIAGSTTSTDFPLTNALETQPNPTYGTGFIIKLTNDGKTILYSTYFGGALGSTSITALATDAKGNLYLTGSTTSADFPNIGGALSQGSSGAIYASISAAGDKILYAGANFAGTTPSQGGFSTFGLGVAVDASGNAYFAYNDVAPIYGPGSPDGYLAKLDPTGKNIFAANLGSFVSALTVDPAGNIYVGLGINGPVQASIEKFDSNVGLLWTNTLQSEATSVTSITVDSAGNVWATGEASPGFPNANGWTSGPEFLIAVNSTGSKLTYSALYPTGTVAQSIAVDPSGFVHVAGSNGFVSAISPTTAPTMKIFGFENAAGGNLTARIAPAELISIYGPGIGPSVATSAPLSGQPGSFFYPKTVAGVQVTINGMNMPLLYVSANQINAIVPMEVTPSAAATIRVINGTTVSPDYPVQIVASAPMAFPTVLNQDFTFNSQTNPASGGSVITFYATGWQPSFAPLVDGQVATTAQDACHGTCTLSTAGSILYGGAAPDIVAGVSQINVKLGVFPTPATPIQLQLSIFGPSTVTQSVWIK